MRVGVLTFHVAHNFGAFLQCYALQSYLESIGCDVDVVDYRPKYLTDQYRVVNSAWIKNPNFLVCTKRSIVFALSYVTRLRKFKRYEKMINHRLNLVDVNAAKYDLLICGSDQVWNKSITGGDYDPFYFLNSKELVSDLKISYAASFGRDEIDVESSDSKLRAYIEALDGVSFRERRGFDAVNGKVTRDVNHVVDPVLLLSKERWLSFAMLPKKSKPYLFIYQVNYDANLRRVAEMYAKQRGLRVVEVTAFVSWKVKDGVYQTKTPDEFVGLIANADCVFTSSFHATAFSIILEKEFYSLSSGHVNDDRCTSLLKECGLLSRSFSPSLETSPSEEEINYTEVKSKMSSLIENSKNYLQSYISVK